LPSVKIVLKTKKPNKKPFPKELKTYCDHLRQKRLDLNLSQPEIAKIVNITTETNTN
jgi:DNA-binding transcriptional regulator YiaG